MPAPLLTPTVVYRVDPSLVERLDERLGPPLDSYVRGWQVWLEDHGPRDARLEWRLHPPAGFRMPRDVNPHDLFDVALQQLADSDDPAVAQLAIGTRWMRLQEVWEVLEVFPAHILDVTVDELVHATTSVLDRRPDAAGMVDHDRLGDLYKSRRGDFSVGQALLGQLEPIP